MSKSGKKRLANATNHNQRGLSELYEKMGYIVDPAPIMPHTGSWQDPLMVAERVVQTALEQKADGILLGGTTELVIYVALLAVQAGLPVYVPRRTELDPSGRREARYAATLSELAPLRLERLGNAIGIVR